MIIFDDLVADTETEYRRTLEFLDVDSSFRTIFDVKNPAQTARNLPVKRFLKTNPFIQTSLGRCLPGAIRGCIGEVLYKLMKQPNRPEAMAPGLRKRLQEQFRPDVERLSEMLGRDLTYWCR